MNVEANEYSKSGTDDQAARLDEAAFDPTKTDPDTQRETAGKNSAEKNVSIMIPFIACIPLFLLILN